MVKIEHGTKMKKMWKTQIKVDKHDAPWLLDIAYRLNHLRNIRVETIWNIIEKNNEHQNDPLFV